MVKLPAQAQCDDGFCYCLSDCHLRAQLYASTLINQLSHYSRFAFVIALIVFKFHKFIRHEQLNATIFTYRCIRKLSLKLFSCFGHHITEYTSYCAGSLLQKSLLVHKHVL